MCVTVVRNSVTMIDHQEIEGITGGALDANGFRPEGLSKQRRGVFESEEVIGASPSRIV